MFHIKTVGDIVALAQEMARQIAETEVPDGAAITVLEKFLSHPLSLSLVSIGGKSCRMEELIECNYRGIEQASDLARLATRLSVPHHAADD